MNDQIPDAVLLSLARDAVAQMAPEELPLFRATSEAYLEGDGAFERGKGSGDDALGFGAGDTLVLVTPIALSVAREVLDFVVDEVRARAREAGKEAIDKLADRLLRKGEHRQQDGGATSTLPAAPETPSLTAEQLRQVRALAVEKAQQLALPPEKASLLADSLVGSLATA
jgi:hypothetical protein